MDSNVIDMQSGFPALKRLLGLCPTDADMMQEFGFTVDGGCPIEEQLIGAAHALIFAPEDVRKFHERRSPILAVALLKRGAELFGFTPKESTQLAQRYYPEAAESFEALRQSPQVQAYLMTRN